MKKPIAILAIAISLLGGVAYAAEDHSKDSPLTEAQAMQRLHEGKTVYGCPMKMAWYTDQPGKCPWHMDVAKVKDIKDGKPVFDESASTNTDMKDMKMMEQTK